MFSLHNYANQQLASMEAMIGVSQRVRQFESSKNTQQLTSIEAMIPVSDRARQFESGKNNGQLAAMEAQLVASDSVRGFQSRPDNQQLALIEARLRTGFFEKRGRGLSLVESFYRGVGPSGNAELIL